MTVPDALAGKQGRCSKCKGPVMVPKPETNGTAAHASKPAVKPVAVAAPPPPVEEPIDAEAAAMSVFDDGPKDEQKASDFIEFNCPQCDEPVKMALDLCGKRHPCPECRRIITVPMPKNRDKLGWRDTGPKRPVGAKRDDLPALEGAWGTGNRTGVSAEALKEAGVIKEKEKPLTLYQKLQPYVLIGVPALVLIVGGLFTWNWMNRTSEKSALAYALKAASADNASKVLGNDGQLAINSYAGAYHVASQKPECATRAREHYTKAVALAASTRSPASDAMLAELAAGQLELGGTEELDTGRRIKWAEVQKLVTAAIREIDNQQGKLAALRRITGPFVSYGQIERLQPMLSTLYPTEGADRSEGLAAVGVELVGLGKTEEAKKFLTDAMIPYGEKKKEHPPLRASVVTLALLLNQKPPAVTRKSLDDEENEVAGRAEALARQGKLDAARALANPVGATGGGKARVLIAVAVGAADTKNGTDDVKTAAEAAKAAGARADLDWPILRLLTSAAQAGVTGDVVEPAVANVSDKGLAAWARLVALRGKLAASKSVEPMEAVEPIPANELGGMVARLELARHNTRLSASWGNAVKNWDEASRALGSMGVAMGMQGGKK